MIRIHDGLSYNEETMTFEPRKWKAKTSENGTLIKYTNLSLESIQVLFKVGTYECSLGTLDILLKQHDVSTAEKRITLIACLDGKQLCLCSIMTAEHPEIYATQATYDSLNEEEKRWFDLHSTSYSQHIFDETVLDETRQDIMFSLRAIREETIKKGIEFDTTKPFIYFDKILVEPEYQGAKTGIATHLAAFALDIASKYAKNVILMGVPGQVGEAHTFKHSNADSAGLNDFYNNLGFMQVLKIGNMRFYVMTEGCKIKSKIQSIDGGLQFNSVYCMEKEELDEIVEAINNGRNSGGLF